MKIPIANLYYLLSYAWDIADELPWDDIDATHVKHPVELLAQILISGTQRIIKKGLDRGYIAFEEELRGVRGKIDIGNSIRTLGHKQGRLFCHFDEYSQSVLHNEIIKATLHKLSKAPSLHKELRSQSYEIWQQLENIKNIEISRNDFNRVQLHANIKHYRMPLSVCQMLFDELLPDQNAGRYAFANFTEEKLFRIFENFLQNFYRIHISETRFTKAKRERFNWQKSNFLSGDNKRLPVMETDVSLLSEKSRLVVESKFYKKALASRFSEKSDGSLISGHLYQLFTYVKNLQEKDTKVTEGILIYPASDVSIKSRYEIHGHSIGVHTIDLMLSPIEIKRNLLEMVA